MAIIYDGSAKALPYGGIYGRTMPRPMGEVAAHECVDDGEGIFTPYATAITFQARSARIFLCFLSRKKERTKESAIVYCGGKPLPQNRESLIKRNGIVTSFALFLLRQLLEIRCRLRRCTYTTQNPAIAPQAVCGLLTYTVLKALG